MKNGHRFAHFKVFYSSGKPVPELDGVFTSSGEALLALQNTLKNMRPTKESVYKERWGDSPVPVVQEKKKRGRPRKNGNRIV